ncbi:MAG: serpin B [Crocinitomix sp.]|jgi:serpin B
MFKIALLSSALLLSTLGFSQNEFTFDFFNTIEDQENILFSPTSIKTAFAMAYEGTNGSTQKEFEKVFNFTENNADFLAEIKQLKKVAQISNSIWVQDNYKILDSFIKVLKNNFDSEPYRTDFGKDPKGSAKKINDWIEVSTNGMIKKMLSAADVAEFKLAIVNAIYFKQNWKKPFEKDATIKADFTNADGIKIEVDMMHASDHYNALEGRNEKVIELPYDDDKTSMVIILPNKIKNYKMTHKVYSDLNAKLVNQRVNLDLPKFTYETPTFKLKGYLEKMGLISAFTDAANFSGIRTERDLMIGTALHKAKIIVNEEGTEAAAATVIGMIVTSSISVKPDPILNIRVDKPFYYFIKDNQSNTILFMGRMNEMAL